MTLYNFSHTCYRCRNRTDIPSLGDFVYGQILLQTSDGQDFYAADLIGNPTFDFICLFLQKHAGSKLGKAGPQQLLALLADEVDGRGFAARYPICPVCKSYQKNFLSNTRTTFREIGTASWNNFESSVQIEKERLLTESIYLLTM